MLGLLAGAARTVGGGIVKSAAKDKAKDFITGKKKKVKPGAIRRRVVKKEHLVKEVVH